MPINENDLENARQDDRARKEKEARKKAEREEKESNEGPRKAIGEAVDYVKGKASQLGEDVTKFAKEYGNVYKKGLGMKQGGSVKSASARADGCAIRGKTRA